ncbi:MAG: DUF4249 domain-containing protein [Hymenobacter sp.]|nr:MAG: DUF4249 domain-containing protein [Hymenobacter sp.]
MSTATAPAEPGATVLIVDNAGTRYPLTEIASGSYRSDSLLLDPARQYQLRLTTRANTTYASDLVPLKVTPPIDKLAWVQQGNYLAVRLSTHDAQQQSRYYRWSFNETWEFNSAYQSFLEYRGGIIQSRITPIYTCWRTEQNTLIKQGSSAQLSQDALTDQPILNIPNRAERIKIRYSVLVSQYAETAQEFAYYDLLRKNTEAVGTVNDPLPTQLTGNVHRVDNASEPVLGYVGAHTVQRQRLFINRQDLPFPTGWQFDTPYQACTLGQEDLSEYKPPLSFPNTVLFSTPGNIPTTTISDPVTGQFIGYAGSSRECVDCRLRGSNVKPSFW